MGFSAEMNLSVAQVKFNRLPSNVMDEIESTMQRLLIRLQRHIQDDKLEGQVLKSHHHTLRNAIHVRGPQRTAKGVEGSVGLGEEAWYGKLHEFGGTFNVPAHIRRIYKYSASGRRSKAPSGQANVRAHTITFPERSFMRTAAREMQNDIIKELEAAAVRGAKK